MATQPAGAARAYPYGVHELSEFFAPQRTSSTSLPEPEPFLRNLTRGILEVFAGVREVDQLARWLTEDAYRKLVTRANLATRARSAIGIPRNALTGASGGAGACSECSTAASGTAYESRRAGGHPVAGMPGSQRVIAQA